MCTRIVYENQQQDFIVGRTLDWEEDMKTDLWAFPIGLERDGGVGAGSITWVSKYASVIASGYGFSSVDGINTAGLVANLLYLVESDYGAGRSSGKPLLSIGAWVQYILDNYATVSEAVQALANEPFSIIAPRIPTMQYPIPKTSGRPSSAHVAISDKTGDSAILEYIEGKLKIYHDRKFNVMTNSPTFDKQLAIAAYWDSIGGAHFLPGSNRAADRFSRMHWLINSVPKAEDAGTSIAIVMSLMRSISVPLGLRDPELPNISSTRWRTVLDTGALRFYFESVYSPQIFWVDLAMLDLSLGAPTKQLDLFGIGDSGRPEDWILSGEVSEKFKAAKPFQFISDIKH